MRAYLSLYSVPCFSSTGLLGSILTRLQYGYTIHLANSVVSPFSFVNGLVVRRVKCCEYQGYDTQFLTLYYVLAAVFALIGTLLLRVIRAGILLGTFGTGMVACLMLALWGPQPLAAYALIATGGFLSVMFPTVFGLAIRDLDGFREKGSALLNFAIVGGAVFPPIQGLIADNHGINLSYIIPALCVVVVTAYGFGVRRN